MSKNVICQIAYLVRIQKQKHLYVFRHVLWLLALYDVRICTKEDNSGLVFIFEQIAAQFV